MSAAIQTQQAPHQPFPIADVRSGMYQAKEPWLSPTNAFAEMIDANAFRGRIRRRTGFDRFTSCGVTAASAVTESSAPPSVLYVLDTTDTKFTPESVTLTWNDPVNGTINANVKKDSFGYQTHNSIFGYGWVVVETGTDTQIGSLIQPYVNLAGTEISGRVVMRWDQHSDYTGTDVALGALSWSEDPQLPIVGLAAYKDTGGTEYLVAINTTRFFVYNVSEGWFEDLIGSDTFTGSATDLFWTWPLEDDLLVTNGVDRVKKYNGAGGTLGNMGTAIGASGDDVDSAQLVIFYRNRVIYLNTVEGGDSKPRRARWSRAGAHETLDVEDFADAPTELGSAVTVQFIADRIMVGFQKGWMELVYTGDPVSLFEFEKTTSVYGATARLGSIADGARILARTENGIEALDPNEQYSADVDIPDYVIDRLDTTNASATFGTRALALKQFWWTVVSSIAPTTSADEMLVAQYQEDRQLSWSRYKLAFNCFAEFRSESTPTWDNIDEAWDDYDTPWDAAKNISGFPVTLAGSANGLIYRAGQSQDHLDDRPFTDPGLVQNAAAVGPQGIPLCITSERLSPFPGVKSHLGWVDFYVDAASTVTITVELRGNSETSAYLARTFTLEPSGTNTKVYKRVRVNKSALFHTITVKASGGGGFAIDAIIPWFRPAGRMRTFG